MNDSITPETLVFGHVSPETARLVDDYPYGRLRCQIRYWIETVKGKGDRFVSQTCNPKTGRWNNPKRSTYSAVMAMWIDPENGHVKHCSVSVYSDDAWIERFVALVGDNLNPFQRAELAQVIGVKRVLARVEFSVKVGTRTPEEEAEQRRQNGFIARAIAAETATAAGELA